ncbi:hypothetical protein MC885_020295 [Smutsia gigantea]|nr:hypothetical protein MC885_020295 [Smutsia gigantea]
MHPNSRRHVQRRALLSPLQVRAARCVLSRGRERVRHRGDLHRRLEPGPPEESRAGQPLPLSVWLCRVTVLLAPQFPSGVAGSDQPVSTSEKGCPPNLHKLDGYYCDHEQGRCYGGRCKTRDRQCQALWGHVAADRFCYEKLNVEGTERGNCGRKGSGWVQCNKQDVLCGFLLCVNISGAPRLGDLGGDISSVTFYHQGKELDCRGGHVQLADGSDLSYVEDGTACGPNMLCLDHRCLPASAFNFSTCPGSGERRICSHHGVCSNEGKCICQPDWTGKDCSIHNPLPTSPPTGETERYKGPSGTNIIIGSIAGAVLVAAIVLGGTGWGFKGLGATPPPSSLAPTVSTLNLKAAPAQPQREAPCTCLPGPSPSTSGLTGVQVGGCSPDRHTTRVDQAWGTSLMVPHPSSCGFGLAHRPSLCERSFHYHRLPQLKGGGRDSGMPQWARPGVVPLQNQAAGTRVLALWDLGRGG